jgi:Kyakuja-Dileera-Zisupton transposase
MDFIIFSCLFGVVVALILFSYDICCQWSRNLKKRIPQLPAAMQPSRALVEKFKFVIPKFHLHNHGIRCQNNFNLNWLRHSAQSDLEDPERWWAHINPVSMSTREMGEGSRHDTINDHALAWNWRKITKFGGCIYVTALSMSLISVAGDKFKSQLTKAWDMHNEHRQAFNRFNATFPQQTTVIWEKMVKDWDRDKNNKNPYEEPEAGTSLLHCCRRAWC